MKTFTSILSRVAMMFIVALLSAYSLDGRAASPADEGETAQKKEVWRCTGTYKSAVFHTEEQKEIVAYDDGSYTIVEPYQAGWHSISFTVNDDGTIAPKGYYAGGDAKKYWYYRVGDNWDLMIYAIAGSKFSGNRYKGFVYFPVCMYTYDLGADVGDFGNDYFEWESDEKPSVDNLSGTWSAKTFAYDYLGRNKNTLQSVDKTFKVVVTKNDDGTYNFKNFYGWDGDMTVTFDKDSKKLTIAPVEGFKNKYTFADITSATEPVVGYIDDDQNILFTNFTAWDGNARKIEMDSRCSMKRAD